MVLDVLFLPAAGQMNNGNYGTGNAWVRMWSISAAEPDGTWLRSAMVSCKGIDGAPTMLGLRLEGRSIRLASR